MREDIDSEVRRAAVPSGSNETVDPTRSGVPHAPTEALLAAVARQDAAAFRTLYDRTAPQLLGVALRILRNKESAEDVVHDIFVKLWHGNAVFDVTLGSAAAFLATVTRNRALDVLRQRGGRREDDGIEMDDVMDLMPSPEAVATDRSDLRALLVCLDGLADGPRRAILAAYVDGASGEDIAARLSAPVGTVKSWIHRGLASLRECMGR